MNLDEALTMIKEKYSLGGQGCVRYYARMKPDPWQVNLDKLESSLDQHEDEFAISVERFYWVAINLINEYKKSVLKPAQDLHPTDAIWFLSQKDIDRFFGNVTESCSMCGSRQNLTIRSVGDTETLITCKKCIVFTRSCGK